MAVVVETTIGDFTIDLYTEERPRTCLNFLKLCKQKYFNFHLMYSIERNYVAQMGDPTGTGRGGDSIFKSMFGDQARLYEGEKLPLLRHKEMGTVSMVSYGKRLYGSQFFVSLGDELSSLDEEHLVFGRVTEGLDVVAKLNDVLTDEKNRPYQDIRISHTIVLEDPYPDPEEIEFPDESPKVTAEVLESEYIAVDEDVDEDKGKDIEEIQEEIAAKEAEARATILEMVGDLQNSDMAPPENVLFVCKLNPVTTSEDLEIIFSRFGKIVCGEVIKDRLTGNSLQYAFIEFDNKKSCEDAYFKMDNVLIDDRRIHVDFSQSVSKIKWRGRGRGVDLFDDRGKKVDNKRDDRFNSKPKEKLNKSNDSQSRFIDATAYGKQYDNRHKDDRPSNHNWRNTNKERRFEQNHDRNDDRNHCSNNRRDHYRGEERRDYRNEADDHGEGKNGAHDHRGGRNEADDRRGGRNEADDRRCGRNEADDRRGGKNEADDRRGGRNEADDRRNEADDRRGGRNDADDRRNDADDRIGGRNDRREGKDDRQSNRVDRNERDSRNDGMSQRQDRRDTKRHQSPDSRRHSSSNVSISSENSKRQKLISQLRAEVKDGSTSDSSSSSDSSDSEIERRKKKKSKQKKDKKNKDKKKRKVDTSESESDIPRKRSKSKHKKHSHSSENDYDGNRKKSKKTKKTKKSKN